MQFNCEKKVRCNKFRVTAHNWIAISTLKAIKRNANFTICTEQYHNAQRTYSSMRENMDMKIDTDEIVFFWHIVATFSK